ANGTSYSAVVPRGVPRRDDRGEVRTRPTRRRGAGPRCAAGRRGRSRPPRAGRRPGPPRSLIALLDVERAQVLLGASAETVQVAVGPAERDLEDVVQLVEMRVGGEFEASPQRKPVYARICRTVPATS